MSLANYLAQNYLTADPPPEKKPKKRKRKGGAQSGLVIADDDDSSWKTQPAIGEETDRPLTITGHTAEFRKAKASQWQTVGHPAPSSTEQAAADAIIASAAAETQARNLHDDDAPIIAPSSPTARPAGAAAAVAVAVAKMESGAHAGLQSADQVTEQLRRKQARERQQFLQDSESHTGRGQETIYRDASGRIISIAMKRAEARQRAEDEAAQAAAELEAQKGDVQRAQGAQRREELAEAKFLPVARYADDAALNAELKDRERWNDPAAAFLPVKNPGASVSGRPLYHGPAMPNRYGIRPGWRWDGVDRGNGFEKEYFAARNRRSNLKELDYAWQMDE